MSSTPPVSASLLTIRFATIAQKRLSLGISNKADLAGEQLCRCPSEAGPLSKSPYTSGNIPGLFLHPRPVPCIRLHATRNTSVLSIDSILPQDHLTTYLVN